MGGKATPPLQPPQPPGGPDSRGMVLLRSWGTLLIGIGALALSYFTYQNQKTNTQRDLELKTEQNLNTQQDIELKQRTFQVQTDLESAKMAISVIPMMSCLDDIKRASAFQVLDNFTPVLDGPKFTSIPKESLRPAAKYEKALVDVLLSKCLKQPPQATSEMSAIRKQVSLQQVQNDFLVTLANARTYQVYGFDGTAARLFYDARNRLPKTLEERVDMAELEKALAAYKEGDFSEASGRFQKAFSRIQ